ncbi:MAG: rod-binding protein [Candidatus Acidiferrum sp.]
MILAKSYLSEGAHSAASAISQNGKSAKTPHIANFPADRKLRQAAGEFEGMLLSSLWKSMKSTFATPDDDASDPAHDTLDDMSIQAMSSAVGKAGGLGLGKLILKHLEPMLANSQSQSAADFSKGSAPLADIQ